MRSRILAAVVGLAALLPALVFGGQVGLEVVAVLVLLVGLDELARMAAPKDRGAYATMMVTGALLFFGLVWGPPELLAPVLAVCTLATMLYGLLGVGETEQGARTGLRLTAGLLYLPLLLSFLPKVRAFDDGLAWIFLLLVVTWLGDTGAYFAGRAFGSRKLFARVSPKKTWEGAIGGGIAAVLGACAVKQLGLPDLSWMHAIILGAILDAGGVLGDLTESLLKRAFGVKDSGWIMPGHGGILDRIDSLLFTAPLAWLYATLFGIV